VAEATSSHPTSPETLPGHQITATHYIAIFIDNTNVVTRATDLCMNLAVDIDNESQYKNKQMDPTREISGDTRILSLPAIFIETLSCFSTFEIILE
jgi:hypothetical protein